MSLRPGHRGPQYDTDIAGSPSALEEGQTATEKDPALPTYQAEHHHGHRVSKYIQPAGESGRRGVHPVHFVKVCWKSSSNVSKAVNVLWPVVPAAIAIRYARSDLHLTIFLFAYVAMVPCANMIGFAGQELARKLRKVFGVLVETTLGSVVEIILFMVLLRQDHNEVIQAAIMGSILATQLLCLGLCFFFGGLRRSEQTFDEAVSEVGSGLLLTAGFGLSIPAVFALAVYNSVPASVDEIRLKVLQISRITSIFLIIAYFIYIWFQMRTHHGIYDAILEGDEREGEGHQEELEKAKLTFIECVIALVVSISLVTLLAIGLVEQIGFIVEERGVSDMFMGLILVPLVEKAAEHLGAVDEAWDNQMNLALSHVLGSTIQTSLFNAPLVVLVSWGVGKHLDLNFETFNVVALILSILVVGNFLRDQQSNYLEGSLCVIIYIIIAVVAFHYPNSPPVHAAAAAAAAPE